MANDFDDLLNNQGGEPGQGGDDPTRGLLDSLLGAAAGGGSGGQAGLGDLLGGLLGGGAGGSGSGAPAGDITDLLGGLMGGGAASGDAPAGDMGDVAGMLGGLLGGGGSGGGAEAGGLGGLLGGVLGGLGGGNQMGFAGQGGPSLPFVGALAEKLGISPQLANMLAMAAIGLLTSSMAKNRSQGLSGGVDLAALTDPDYLRTSGVAGRLSGQMGVSEEEAILGLQQAMGMMSGQTGAVPVASAKKKPAKKPSTPKTGPKQPAASSKSKKAPAKKSATKKTASSKPAGDQSGSDFMDLLDDLTK